MGNAPATASEAMDMVHAGLGWLAAADATAMAGEEQARCLQRLEQAASMGTAARASVLAAFTELPRVFRTGNSAVIYAAACISSNSSMTSCGVL